MENHEITQNNSKLIQIVITVVAFLFLGSLLFASGMTVGSYKAGFQCRWGENYQKNFGSERRGPFGMMQGRNFGAHGNFSTIIKIEGPLITVKDRAGVEKVIVTNSATVINRGPETVTVSDLKVNDKIVTLGNSNQNGQIEATLIRIFPFDFPSSFSGGNPKS